MKRYKFSDAINLNDYLDFFIYYINQLTCGSKILRSRFHLLSNWVKAEALMGRFCRIQCFIIEPSLGKTAMRGAFVRWKDLAMPVHR